MYNLKNKKTPTTLIKLSLISSLLITTNSFAVFGVGDIVSDPGNTAAVNANTAAVQLAAATSLAQDEFSLLDSLFNGRINTNLNKYADSMLKSNSAMGGKYGKATANVLKECFSASIPEFSTSFDLGGLDFCGIGEANDLLGDLLKKSNKGTKDKGKVKTKKVKDVSITDESNNSKEECTEEEIEKLKKATKKKPNGGILIENKENCVPLYYYPNLQAEKILKDEFNALNRNANEKGIRLNDSPEEKEVAKTITNDSTEKDFLVNPKESKISNRIDQVLSREKAKITNRGTINLNTGFEYNLRYNPEIVFNDKESGFYAKLNAESKGKKYKDSASFTNSAITYLVPTLKGEGIGKNVDLNMFGVDKYKDATNDFLQDVSKDEENMYKKLGGITSLTSGILGYKKFTTSMAENLLTSEEEAKKSAGSENGDDAGENGEIGRSQALVTGLKGIMYQLLLLNHQNDTEARMNYIAEVINHNAKMKIKADVLNTNVEKTIVQNAEIIRLLKKIAQE